MRKKMLAEQESMFSYAAKIVRYGKANALHSTTLFSLHPLIFTSSSVFSPELLTCKSHLLLNIATCMSNGHLNVFKTELGAVWMCVSVCAWCQGMKSKYSSYISFVLARNTVVANTCHANRLHWAKEGLCATTVLFVFFLILNGTLSFWNYLCEWIAKCIPKWENYTQLIRDQVGTYQMPMIFTDAKPLPAAKLINKFNFFLGLYQVQESKTGSMAMGLSEPSNLLWQETIHPLSLTDTPTCSDNNSIGRALQYAVLSSIFGIGDCVSHKIIYPSLILAVEFYYALWRKSNRIRKYAKVVLIHVGPLTFCLLDWRWAISWWITQKVSVTFICFLLLILRK